MSQEQRDATNDEELPGMLAVAKGVAEQKWPHTMDAAVWAEEFCKLFHPVGKNPPYQAMNATEAEGLMIGWFANAIMAGYDTAQARAAPTDNVGATDRWQDPRDLSGGATDCIPSETPQISPLVRVVRSWRYEPADTTQDDPGRLTRFWGRVFDEKGRFISHIGTAHAEALFGYTTNAAPQAGGGTVPTAPCSAPAVAAPETIPSATLECEPYEARVGQEVDEALIEKWRDDWCEVLPTRAIVELDRILDKIK